MISYSISAMRGTHQFHKKNIYSTNLKFSQQAAGYSPRGNENKIGLIGELFLFVTHLIWSLLVLIILSLLQTILHWIFKLHSLKPIWVMTNFNFINIIFFLTFILFFIFFLTFILFFIFFLTFILFFIFFL